MAIGVDVTTSTRTGPSNAGPSSSRFQIAGLTERGPIDKSVIVKSIAQFESVYGVRTAYASNLYDTARTFWEEGGTELVVSRAVGPAASKGALTLKDGSGEDSVKVEATSAGAYSTDLRVEIAAGATAGTFTFLLTQNGVLVTSLRNLASPAALVQALSTNPYVRASDLGSATAAPGNNPDTLAATAMTSGADDRAAVTADMVVAALNLPTTDVMGASVDIDGCMVAAPGYPADIVGEGLIAHAKAKGKVAALAGDVDATPESIAVLAQGLIGVDGSYAGLFYPHVVIPDGSGTRTLSPEGYVAAARSRAHVTEGFWQAAPGDRSIPRWVLGTVNGVDKDTNDTLADSQVNGLVTIGGKVRVYGWASLSSDKDNFALLSARDSLNNLTAELRIALEPYVFATVDGRRHLLGKVEAACVGVLDPIATAGGLYALIKNGKDLVDSGYRVVVDETLNTASTLANNEVRVSVSVRLAPMAALISAEIIKVALGSSV